MTDLPARQLPQSLTGAARSAAQPDDIGDVLASIRRLIAQEDGTAPAAVPPAAPLWTAPAPMLRAPSTAALAQAVDAASTRMAATAQRADSLRQAGAQQDAAMQAPRAHLPGGFTAAPAAASPAGAGSRSGDAPDAPLRLRPDALIPPARPVPRSEGRLRLLSVLGTAGAEAAAAPAPADRTGAADIRDSDAAPQWPAAADSSAVPLVSFAADRATSPRQEPKAAPAAVPAARPEHPRTVPAQGQGDVSADATAALHDDSHAPVGNQAASAAPAAVPPARLEQPRTVPAQGQGDVSADATTALHDDSHAPFGNQATSAATDLDPPPPAANDSPAATPEPPQSDGTPDPASLRGLLRAAIRQELRGEIDSLVTGPLHRLIRAEVARAVAEVFGDADRALHR
ncbi:hypothetical protein [Paracoccus luteus]|uniref:hypothetical protein n=1 Tax=Paracoccus luteus TaxID=2508543 RepID=UPI00106FFB3A|nr:hypothetical protein [Paracoccus luteus]